MPLKSSVFFDTSLQFSSVFIFFNARHVQGVCDHVAMIMKHMHGLDVDPLSDIAICCGQSEAFAATVFASMFSYLRSLITQESYVL